MMSPGLWPLGLVTDNERKEFRRVDGVRVAGTWVGWFIRCLCSLVRALVFADDENDQVS